jgi:flagellum-specific ATP synthase
MIRQSLAQRSRQYTPKRPAILLPTVEGKLTRVVGLTLEAVGCNVTLGGRCSVSDGNGQTIEAEVVGFDGPRIYLMPLTSIDGLKPGARVVPLDDEDEFAVGEGLLGRVLGGLGQPIDGKGELKVSAGERAKAKKHGSINPLERQPIRKPLDVGIATINALLTVGRGQRLGLFAGSGVGKSVLLGMMTQFTTADVIVVGLIGERGREVKVYR